MVFGVTGDCMGLNIRAQKREDSSGQQKVPDRGKF